MSTPDTRDRLLDAAERLFAQHGLGATSLRAVTAEAGANLASVHYHFGSKEALIHAVFDRRLGPLNRERLRLLDAAEAASGGGPPPLEAVVEAFVGPALRLRHDPAHGGRDFMCLMGRLYSEPGDVTQKILEQFDEVFRRFSTALGRALPHLPQPDLSWRFFFMVGSMITPLVGPEVIAHKTGGRCDPSDVEGTLRRLVTFIAAGLRAPVPEPVGETR